MAFRAREYALEWEEVNMTLEEAYEKWLESPNLPRFIMPLDAFSAAWRMAGEEAAKIAQGWDDYEDEYETRPYRCKEGIAKAIRRHFGAISKHYDVTGEEPK